MSGRASTALNYYADRNVIDPNGGKSVREAYGKGAGARGAAPTKGSLFSRFGKGKPSGDEPGFAYDVGIRPSFYWLDAELTVEERAAQEALARSLKHDCQDEAAVVEDFAGVRGALFVGVFDGHGPDGRAAAKFAASALPRHLEREKGVWGDDVKRRYKAFKQAAYHTNDDLHRPMACHLNATLSGTTACFALLHGRAACVGSTGDSRCVVVRAAPGGGVETEQLSWDAKPEVADEQRRIQARGGIVAQLQDPSGQSVGAYRVFRKPGDLLPGLAMSRSLGDSLAHSLGVVAKPAFKVYELRDDDLFLVFGTDGVFDVMDNQRVGEALQAWAAARDPALSAADVLTAQAQEAWKSMGEDIIVDDTAAVVVHLQPLPPPAPKGSAARGGVPAVRAGYTNDAANALFSLYSKHPEADPRLLRPADSAGAEFATGADQATKVLSA